MLGTAEGLAVSNLKTRLALAAAIEDHRLLAGALQRLAAGGGAAGADEARGEDQRDGRGDGAAMSALELGQACCVLLDSLLQASTLVTAAGQAHAAEGAALEGAVAALGARAVSDCLEKLQGAAMEVEAARGLLSAPSSGPPAVTGAGGTPHRSLLGYTISLPVHPEAEPSEQQHQQSAPSLAAAEARVSAALAMLQASLPALRAAVSPSVAGHVLRQAAELRGALQDAQGRRGQEGAMEMERPGPEEGQEGDEGLFGAVNSCVELCLLAVQRVRAAALGGPEGSPAASAAAPAAGAAEEEGALEAPPLQTSAARAVEAVQSLGLHRLLPAVQRVCLALSRSQSRSQSLPLAQLLPPLQAVAALHSVLVSDLASWHAEGGKLLYVLLRVYRTLLAKGYCGAQVQEEEGGDGSGMSFSDDNDGTGMGEGEGKKDVSDQIENEDQLVGLKGDQPEVRPTLFIYSLLSSSPLHSSSSSLPLFKFPRSSPPTHTSLPPLAEAPRPPQAAERGGEGHGRRGACRALSFVPSRSQTPHHPCTHPSSNPPMLPSCHPRHMNTPFPTSTHPHPPHR